MKKVTLGIFVFAVISLLGLGIIAAFPLFGQGSSPQDLTEEERQAFHDAMKETLDNQDFEAWKELMSAKLSEDQLTEERFQMMVERRQQMLENGMEMHGPGAHSGEMMQGCPCMATAE